MNTRNVHPRRDILRAIIELTSTFVSRERTFYKFFLQYISAEPHRHDLNEKEQFQVALLVGLITQAKKLQDTLLECVYDDPKPNNLELVDQDSNALGHLSEYVTKMYPQMVKYSTRVESLMRMMMRRTENIAFCKLVESCHDIKYFQKLPILAHFILPLRFAARLSELLSKLMTYTPDTHTEHAQMAAALNASNAYRKLLGDSNSTVRGRIRSLDIFENMEQGNFYSEQLISPNRVLVSEGELYRVNSDGSTKFVKALLFNDVVFIIEDPNAPHKKGIDKAFKEIKESKPWRVVCHIDLSRSWISPASSSNGFQIITFSVVYSSAILKHDKMSSYCLSWTKEILLCVDEEDKQHWLTSLVDTIETLATNVPIFDCRAEISAYVKLKQQDKIEARRSFFRKLLCGANHKATEFDRLELIPEEAQISHLPIDDADSL